MAELKYKVSTAYRIYIIERGLLVEPTQYGSKVFSAFDTMDEAVRAFGEGKTFADECVILPVTQTVIDWGEE